MSVSDNLDDLRKQIDAVDGELLRLFNQRAKLAQEVGEVKGGAVVYRPEREAQVLRRLTGDNPGPLPASTVAPAAAAVAEDRNLRRFRLRSGRWSLLDFILGSLSVRQE